MFSGYTPISFFEKNDRKVRYRCKADVMAFVCVFFTTINVLGGDGFVVRGQGQRQLLTHSPSRLHK